LTASASASARITRGHRNLLLVAAVMTCLLVTLGGTVCATESGMGCPDWPGCYGRIIPPPQIKSVIEYTHRLVAALTSPLIIAAAVVSWRRTRSVHWVSRPLAVSLVFLVAVIIFGALIVLTGLPPVIAAIDLGSALLVLALVVTAATVAWRRYHSPGLPDRLSLRTPLARLSLAALGAVYAIYISGVLVAGQGSLTRCLGGPLWQILPDDRPGWPQVARLALAALAALLVVALVVRAARTVHDRGLRRTALYAGLAFLAEAGITALLVWTGTSSALLVLHVVAAAVLWALLVAVTVQAALLAAAEAH
jgi:heme A synthase